MSSFISTSRHWDICINASKGGRQALVHHLEMVAWSIQSFSASHLFVFPFSASITFIRLKFFSAIAYIIIVFGCKPILILLQISFVKSENHYKKRKIICLITNKHPIPKNHYKTLRWFKLFIAMVKVNHRNVLFYLPYSFFSFYEVKFYLIRLPFKTILKIILTKCYSKR